MNYSAMINAKSKNYIIYLFITYYPYFNLLALLNFCHKILYNFRLKPSLHDSFTYPNKQNVKCLCVILLNCSREQTDKSL